MSERSIPKEQLRLESTLESEFGELLQPETPHAWKEFGLSFRVSAEDAYAVFEKLRNSEAFLFNMLIDVTAVDWLDSRETRFDVVYQLLSLTFGHRLCLKIAVGEDKPKVASVRPLWPAANFLEREVWDMYGIDFSGHEDLRRILMYEEFVGHPLRKDYPLRGKQPRVELRIPELRNTSADMHREELVSLPVRQRIEPKRAT